MKNPAYTFSMKSLSLAVAAGLFAQSGVALAQSEEEAIEEVVATGTRLKGTATAVMEERKNQAFVADIMGAEQISRTGDGDAASALRRVTGLTLVDGKFIYVSNRGHNSITGFAVDAKTGKLKSIGQFATGEVPRSFNLGPNNKWLIAAGQRSHDLHIYERNPKTGKLTKVRQQPTGKGPGWVQFIPIRVVKK